jgi:5-formyltetrahydrofolate cyclo-ligase
VSEALLEKRALRQRLLKSRLSSSEEAIRDSSSTIVARLLAMWTGQRRVALFWPMLSRGEVDLRELDTELRARHASLYYPRLEGPSSMEFRLLSRVDDLVLHPFGFLEPPGAAPVADTLDWIVVPALAATRRGERLGYGGGHYDRALGRLGAGTETIAVVRAAELLDALPLEAHDRKVRWVVTENDTIGPLD